VNQDYALLGLVLERKDVLMIMILVYLIIRYSKGVPPLIIVKMKELDVLYWREAFWIAMEFVDQEIKDVDAKTLLK
jgi:hypothetical protein